VALDCRKAAMRQAAGRVMLWTSLQGEATPLDAVVRQIRVSSFLDSSVA
jgi:hypothetical protein